MSLVATDRLHSSLVSVGKHTERMTRALLTNVFLRRRRHKDPVTELGPSGMAGVGGRRDVGDDGGGGVDKGCFDIRAQLRWDSRNSCNLQHSGSCRDDIGCVVFGHGYGGFVGGTSFRCWYFDGSAGGVEYSADVEVDDDAGDVVETHGDYGIDYIHWPCDNYRLYSRNIRRRYGHQCSHHPHAHGHSTLPSGFHM